MAAGRLAAISVYPVKSAAGVTLDACRVEARGLAGVRRAACSSGRTSSRAPPGTVRVGDPVEVFA